MLHRSSKTSKHTHVVSRFSYMLSHSAHFLLFCSNQDIWHIEKSPVFLPVQPSRKSTLPPSRARVLHSKSPGFALQPPAFTQAGEFSLRLAFRGLPCLIRVFFSSYIYLLAPPLDRENKMFSRLYVYVNMLYKHAFLSCGYTFCQWTVPTPFPADMFVNTCYCLGVLSL